MITIWVKYHNVLRHMATVPEEAVEMPAAASSSSRAVLEHLAQERGAPLRDALLAPDGEISSHLVVFRNRKLMRPEQHDDPLADGDELMLFPAIAGG